MKRTLLDITQKVSRKIYLTRIDPYDLTNNTYWIYIASGWKFVDLLPEMEIPDGNYKLFITINTQYVSPKDYDIEQKQEGIAIKFKKANFPYTLTESDFIEIKGDIEKYA